MSFELFSWVFTSLLEYLDLAVPCRLVGMELILNCYHGRRHQQISESVIIFVFTQACKEINEAMDVCSF